MKCIALLLATAACASAQVFLHPGLTAFDTYRMPLMNIMFRKKRDTQDQQAQSQVLIDTMYNPWNIGMWGMGLNTMLLRKKRDADQQGENQLIYSSIYKHPFDMRYNTVWNTGLNTMLLRKKRDTQDQQAQSQVLIDTMYNPWNIGMWGMGLNTMLLRKKRDADQQGENQLIYSSIYKHPFDMRYNTMWNMGLNTMLLRKKRAADQQGENQMIYSSIASHPLGISTYGRLSPLGIRYDVPVATMLLRKKRDAEDQKGSDQLFYNTMAYDPIMWNYGFNRFLLKK